MTERARGPTTRPDLYADVRLRLDPMRPQVALARCVAAEVAMREGAGPDRVEEVRAAVDRIVTTHAVLAAPASPVTCLFRMLAGELRISVTVQASADRCGVRQPAGSGVLRRLVGRASTVTVPTGDGTCRVCSDVVIDLRD